MSFINDVYAGLLIWWRAPWREVARCHHQIERMRKEIDALIETNIALCRAGNEAARAERKFVEHMVDGVAARYRDDQRVWAAQRSNN